VTPATGAKRILLYNWPTFAATWGGAIAVALWARRLDRGSALALVVAAAAAVAWSCTSLLASHFIYDRSELSGGRWLGDLVPTSVREWVAVDAGLDAEIDLRAAMPGRCLAQLDIFDPRFMRGRSVRRARRLTRRVHPAQAASPIALPLGDGSCDAVTVVFTAHEVRDVTARQAFFTELHRILRPGGRALLVEHLRDAANLLVFGPGFLHFLPRSDWLRVASAAGFRVAAERRVTPWVMALVLEKERA
jgi:SAM-dependent methyltransferase